MTGDELKALRKRTGMTQAAFGAALGLSGPYIGELERGEKAIDERIALAAQMVLELSLVVRVSTGRFGDKHVVIVTKKMTDKPGRVHEVQTPTYDSAAAAAEAAIALARDLDADLHLVFTEKLT